LYNKSIIARVAAPIRKIGVLNKSSKTSTGTTLPWFTDAIENCDVINCPTNREFSNLIEDDISNSFYRAIVKRIKNISWNPKIVKGFLEWQFYTVVGYFKIAVVIYLFGEKPGGV